MYYIKMGKERQQFLFSEILLVINNEVAYKRIIKCTKFVGLGNVGECLYKARCK
jgi:hypothetical protein